MTNPKARTTGTRSVSMYKSTELKCAKCNSMVYYTKLTGKIYCKECREYKGE